MTKAKRALVTGSTRGIGRAAAVALLRDGFEVILHGRRAGDVAKAVAELGGSAKHVTGVAGELSQRVDVHRIAAEVGEVDVLVNSAGVFEELRLGAIGPVRFRETIEVNVTAPWLLTRTLLEGLRRRRGVVVNVGSDSGVLGFAGGVTYCASKGAIVGLTRALAVELAPDLRTICIAPGPVQTDMMDDSVARAPDRDAALQQWADYTHLRRVAKPEEIGEMIAFAASDRASFATGAVWLLDGGVTAGKRI